MCRGVSAAMPVKSVGWQVLVKTDTRWSVNIKEIKKLNCCFHSPPKGFVITHSFFKFFWMYNNS